MKRKKNKSPQQLYQAARGNLLLMLIFSAVNVAFAAFGVDIYFLFSDYLAYMLALTGRVFLEYSDEGLYLAVGLAFAVLVLVPYLLCWIFSKKRRGWMIAALVLFAVDTGALVVDTLGSDDVLYNLPDLLFHIWVLVYLVLGVKHAQQALAPQPEETPANGSWRPGSLTRTSAVSPTPPPSARRRRSGNTAFSSPPTGTAATSRCAAAAA